MNEYYEASVKHMTVQINYLEELINRTLTEEEREHIHEIFFNLDENLQNQFIAKVGPLL